MRYLKQGEEHTVSSISNLNILISRNIDVRLKVPAFVWNEAHNFNIWPMCLNFPCTVLCLGRQSGWAMSDLHFGVV